jgi:threonine dehydratase
VLSGKVPGDGQVITIISGGNVDPILLIRLIEHGLTAAGRFLMLRIVVVDHPGELAHLTDAVAHLGLNVLDVEHHRVGLKLGVDKVAVMMTVETRDQTHRDEAVRALRDAGFDVQPVE